jgi:hypothetical protein
MPKRTFCTFLTLAGFAIAQVTAEPPKAEEVPLKETPPWITRTYAFPSDLLARGFHIEKVGHLDFPELPDAKASEADILAYLKQTNHVASVFFNSLGYAVPPGSLLTLDPKSSKLVARTTEDYHTFLEVFSTQAVGHVQQVLTFSLDILEADATTIREEIKAAGTVSNHEPMLARLSALADQGKARRVSELQVESRHNIRVKIGNADDRNETTNFTVEKEGSLHSTNEYQSIGTTLEIDPMVSDDGSVIDLNFALLHDFAVPTQRWERAPVRVNGKLIESLVSDAHRIKTVSAISMTRGSVKLLSVWSPETNVGEAKDVLQVAFLRVQSNRLLTLENVLLRQWVDQFGNQTSSTPKAPPTLPKGSPSSMVTRSFYIDSRALELKLADYFSPDAFDDLNDSSKKVFRFITPEALANTKSNVLKQLKSLGLNIPEGSSITYNPSFGILLIRSTPQCLELLETLLRSGIRSGPTKLLQLTAHIVQAEGPFLRNILQKTRGITDHSQVWHNVEDAVAKNQARILRSMWIPTRSGLRSSCDFGQNYTLLDMASPVPENVKDSNPESKPEEKTKDTQTTPIPASASSSINVAPHPTLTIENNAQLVGTSLEIDPVICEDGQTVNLNLALKYDFSMPTRNALVEVVPGNVIRPETRVIDFHQTDINLATSQTDGTWRLMGVWKPRGSAEFDGKDVLQALFVRVDIKEVNGKY